VTRLFIELYLDEDVSALVADLVRARGFVASTTHESKQLAGSDAEQLEYATSQQQTLLTHNRADFERLAQQYFSTGRAHCGIIIAVRRTPYEIVQRLLTILNQVTADEMKNQVRYI
jgi:predicted nuclease of predicted toxin-antitoxin system